MPLYGFQFCGLAGWATSGSACRKRHPGTASYMPPGRCRRPLAGSGCRQRHNPSACAASPPLRWGLSRPRPRGCWHRNPSHGWACRWSWLPGSGCGIVRVLILRSLGVHVCPNAPRSSLSNTSATQEWSYRTPIVLDKKLLALECRDISK